jgi:hypothetical protein
MKRLEPDLRKAVTGALNRRKHSPLSNFAAIDWKLTVKRNLKNFDPQTKRLIPDKFYFFENSRRGKEWTVIIDIDQSGSMSDSIIYSSVMSTIFASLPMLDTRVVVFDDDVVDMTDVCRNDPVDMLFGLQLGGGTDINRSVAYCMDFIVNPRKTLFILVSDLHEGGVQAGLIRRLSQMHQNGVKVLALLALSDSGQPIYNVALAREIRQLGIVCFACSPDRLPELTEAAISGRDLANFVHGDFACDIL